MLTWRRCRVGPQDLMYFSIMRKFVHIGVDLLPPLARAPHATTQRTPKPSLAIMRG